MELNNKNKAKFFAQYWGQIILTTEATHPDIKWLNNSCHTTVDAEYLELKPLSSITDEDAITVAKILKIKIEEVKIVRRPNSLGDQCVFFENPFGDGYMRAGILNLIHFSFDVYGFNPHSLYTIQAFDILRSKGYALPWMGISVQDQVKAGWIKLINP